MYLFVYYRENQNKTLKNISSQQRLEEQINTLKEKLQEQKEEIERFKAQKQQ